MNAAPMVTISLMPISDLNAFRFSATNYRIMVAGCVCHSYCFRSVPLLILAPDDRQRSFVKLTTRNGFEKH